MANIPNSSNGLADTNTPLESNHPKLPSATLIKHYGTSISFSMLRMKKTPLPLHNLE